MGASNSKLSTEKIANWIETGRCSCDQKSYYAIKVIWKSVPLAGQFWVGVGRILLLGLAEIKYKGQQYSHDCIQIEISCRQCGCSMYVTMQFSPNGKTMRYGYYHKTKSIMIEHEHHQKYEEIITKYDRMWNNGYDLGSNNCKHWAKSFYSNL